MNMQNLINKNSIVCFFDGACEPKNPGGNMGLGAVIFIDGKGKFIYSGFVKSHPANSNNVAEYSALIWVLQQLLVSELNEKVVHIYGDSMLVVKQMSGQWRIKQGYYIDYAKDCKELLKQFKNISIQWIPREENYYADDLSKGKLVENGIEFKIQKPTLI